MNELIRRLFRRFKKNESGVSLIEFALVLPLLLALVLGIIEFGWLFNGYITITGAAREGARFAVVGKDDLIVTAVENHLGHLQISNLNVDPGSANPGEERTIEVNGDMQLLTGFFPFVDNPFPLRATATMRQEMVAAGGSAGGGGSDPGPDPEPDPDPPVCLGPPDCRPPNNIHPDCPACN